jgi:hypothetical protein
MGIPRDKVRDLVPHIALPEIAVVHCLLMGNNLLVVKRKRRGAGGLADLGVAKSDDYMAHWRNRDVYEGGEPG